VLAALAFAAALRLQPGPAACPDLALRLGPEGAPVAVTAYLDPFTGPTLALWLELRRLVADGAGALGVRIVPIGSAMIDSAGDARVLRWLIGVAARGKQEAALRLIDRDGRERLALRLGDPAGRAEVAGELGMRPDDHAAALDDPCAAEALRAGKAALQRLHAAAGGYLGRPPLFAVGDSVAFEDTSTLDRLRLELGRERQRKRGFRPPTRPVAQGRKGVSPRLMRPPASAGMLVGGVGLPHRLVVFADHDEHPNFSLLGPAMQYRAKNPGRLAIQVIARGNSAGARQLRLRACVAEKLGLQLDYLRLLAREGGKRETRGAAASELIARLEGAPEAQSCELGEPELERGPGGVTALPEGVWLDGAAVGQSDLEALAARLQAVESAQRPLDAVFSATAPEP
jgi:2-hydroxychromene-2-carboxylate isomerase